MSGKIERRLVAILAADVVGYSRLMNSDEAGTLATLKSHRRDIWDPTIAEFGGRVVGVAGDSLLVEFASAVAAVECAVGVQKSMALRNAAHRGDHQMQWRVGVNISEVIVEGGEVFGEGVNIAARLESICEPGGVALSEDALRQVDGKTGLQFVAAGQHKVKNIPEPIRMWRWVDSVEDEVSPNQAGATRTRILSAWAASDPEFETRSIIVMPLVNMSGDPDQNYLADGITEDIITDLSRWKQLRVLSRNSSFHFRHLAADLVKLRWDLGAAYVVAGSVHRLGDRLRLSIQLNETASGRQIWAERYDRSVDKAFALQETIVRTIVGTLVGRIEAADRAISRRKNPASMDAYDCVLRGNGLPWIEPVASLEASDWYRKAIEIDPTYGRAYALLALQLETQWEYDESGSNTLLEQALELALKAVELDDNESTAFSVLGRIYLQRRCFDLAERYYRRAYDINPGNPLAIALMGDIEIHLGRSEMAVEWLEKAKSVDPYFDPEWYWPMRGLALYCARRYEEAIVAYGQSLRAPYWVPAYVAACHAQAGREDEAKAIMTELLRDVPSLNVPSFADGHTFRDEADFAHILEGMRKAGLPN